MPEFLENVADSAIGTYHGNTGGGFGGRDTRSVSISSPEIPDEFTKNLMIFRFLPDSLEIVAQYSASLMVVLYLFLTSICV